MLRCGSSPSPQAPHQSGESQILPAAQPSQLQAVRQRKAVQTDDDGWGADEGTADGAAAVAAAGCEASLTELADWLGPDWLGPARLGTVALGWGGAFPALFKDGRMVVSMRSGGGVSSSCGTPESLGILDSCGSCAVCIFQPIQLETRPAKQPTNATASVITATCAAAKASSEASLDSSKTFLSSALASEVTASASSDFSTASSMSWVSKEALC